ncbi:hypothetical protein [Reyranella sp.]|uniref:hypothetical protein n=1 Tax=Reyranella sp. TaxID=1929291 RepID=UPI0037834AEF
MLGTKRTIPFWQAKRPLLSLERALSSLRQVSRKSMIAATAPALATVKARSRLQQEAKRKGRFSEG